MLSESGEKISAEQIYFEYLCFLCNLPILIKTEKDRLIKLVEKEWNIKEISRVVADLDFRKLSKIKYPNQMRDELVPPQRSAFCVMKHSH